MENARKQDTTSGDARRNLEPTRELVKHVEEGLALEWAVAMEEGLALEWVMAMEEGQYLEGATDLMVLGHVG